MFDAIWILEHIGSSKNQTTVKVLFCVFLIMMLKFESKVFAYGTLKCGFLCISKMSGFYLRFSCVLTSP